MICKNKRKQINKIHTTIDKLAACYGIQNRRANKSYHYMKYRKT